MQVTGSTWIVAVACNDTNAAHVGPVAHPTLASGELFGATGLCCIALPAGSLAPTRKNAVSANH